MLYLFWVWQDMHKLLFFVFSFLLSLPIAAENPVLKKAELRVLDIGNSYTLDATNLLPLIAEASKADLSTMCLYQCYRSGGSYKNWVDVYNDNDNAETYKISKVIGDLPANVKTGTGEAGDGQLFRDVLTNEKWDLIIIHQYSSYAPYYSMWNNDSAAGHLDELISIIREHQPNAEFGFLLVHSYWSEYKNNKEKSSFDRWQLIANSAKSFCEDYNIDFVIPYGTAIQNLRASSLNNEYDLTRDGTHCGYGLAQYTAACCYYESLIAPRCGISVLGNPARIDVSDKTSTYPSVNVTDENAFIAQKAAYLATKDMYHCYNPESETIIVKKYKLIYMVDGVEYKTQEIEYGTKITPEVEPTKEGYTFSGWSDIPSTMPAKDVTVTGSFTVNKYKLIYMVDGVEYKTQEIEYGSEITPESAPAKEGYTFSGWSDIPATMPAKDVTVTGSFTVNKYKLIYMVDGVEYKAQEIEYGAKITPEPAPTKEGYIFSGWSDIPTTMPAKDVTVTGSFIKGSYKLTYMVDGEVYKTIGYDYGDAITPEPTPTKEGYTFSGWSDIPATMPAKDVTITGSFTVNKYKLVYMVDGVEYKTQEIEYGAKITPEAEPTKEGYTFSGWSDIPATMPAKDVTVTGSFTQIDFKIGDVIYEITSEETVSVKKSEQKGSVEIVTMVEIEGHTYYVTDIGTKAFRDNKDITSVTIPDGIRTIGYKAFKGCTGLVEISIGKDVNSIDYQAFANIGTESGAGTRSKNGSILVNCYAKSVPLTSSDAFDNAPIETGMLLVEDTSVDAYKTTSPWNRFGTIMGFDEAAGIKSIEYDSPNARIYDMLGNRINHPKKGVNIILMNDGRTKKVVGM